MLFSEDGRFSLELKLLALTSRAHAGWHSYELSVGLCGHSDHAVLRSTDEAQLFLDAHYEEEVVSLCFGIQDVVTRGGAYRFEPCDEGEFSFQLRSNGTHFEATVHARDRPFEHRFGWATGVTVTATALGVFTKDLLEQFSRLMSSARNLK